MKLNISLLFPERNCRRNCSNPLTILRGNIKKVVKNVRNNCPCRLLQHWFTSILWHLEESITDFKIFLNFRFLPFSSYHKNYEKYVPSLCKSGKYGQEAYGTKYFREVYPEKWIADKVSHCENQGFIYFFWLLFY